MLALVMCLLVLGVAGAIVVRDGLRDGTDKGATAPAKTQRARSPKARPASPERPPRPPRAPRPAGRHRVRSGLVLLVSTAGIGVLTGTVLGLLFVILALVLRSVGGEGP